MEFWLQFLWHPPLGHIDPNYRTSSYLRHIYERQCINIRSCPRRGFDNSQSNVQLLWKNTPTEVASPYEEPLTTKRDQR